MKRIIFIIMITSFIFYSCTTRNNSATEKEAALYSRAVSLYDAGNFEDVIILLDKEKYIPSMVLRGKSFYFLDKTADAEKEFRAVIKKRNSAVEASIFLARILRENGKTDEALKIVDSILMDDPQNIRALRIASGIQFDKGPQYQKDAIVYLDRVVSASQEAALAILERARYKWISGHESDALLDLAGAKTLFPPDTPLLEVVQKIENSIKESVK